MPRRAWCPVWEQRWSHYSLFVPANAIDREGRKLGGVFLVFTVNQETGGRWVGGKRKEVESGGRNFCSRWCRATKWPMYVCVCVFVCL